VKDALAQVAPILDSLDSDLDSDLDLPAKLASQGSNMARVTGATKRKLDMIVSESEESDIPVDEDIVNQCDTMEVDEEVEVQCTIPNAKLSRSTAKVVVYFYLVIIHLILMRHPLSDNRHSFTELQASGSQESKIGRRSSGPRLEDAYVRPMYVS